MTWFVTKTCHFLGFFYWRWTKKHSYWLKIFFGPMKMFSCPPSINKNKEVTSFCDKSRHLFLWQTNRTSLELLLQLSASASLTISSEFSGLMYELELIEITSMESTIQFLKHIFLLYTWIISILNLSWFLNSWILISNGFE